MKFRFMPLSTASSTFQKAMLSTLGHLKFVTPYFNDELLVSSSRSEHLHHLQAVLATLRAAGYTVNPSKTSIGFSSIDFLGHIVGCGSFRHDYAKTEKKKKPQNPSYQKGVSFSLGSLELLPSLRPRY
ncbi:retrovirus-related pol polyprotein from transposon opus [Plakobranchus ocellatus]|uniref:Retrovirus-related pol polyprotein from transposon opus n=1 Tax=Plakobranchus ocellatus TaxID=259542 RepID=A0AAV4DVP1_9GAST|nr:retrovirus-related pol polyprotein from transposon opus [Plakobranchus ocellatus]